MHAHTTHTTTCYMVCFTPSYTWHTSHAEWNRLMHALHGNTATAHGTAPATSDRPSRGTRGAPHMRERVNEREASRE